MGKKNPIKQATEGITNAVFNPLRETARAVGLDDAVRGVDDVKKVYNDVGKGGIDLANNEKGKQRKKADREIGEMQKQQALAASNASAAAAAAENSRIEGERMNAGSASRTLLTGPAGLEDEEDSISRRTLAGF